MPLRRFMFSPIQTFCSIFLKVQLRLANSCLFQAVLSRAFPEFRADVDVGFHGNVTRDDEREASMVPSFSHSLQSPLCYFFVNYWDVCWSPCRPCCSCSQCQVEHWLWTGTWSWLFSAAWHSHVILFWQGMEVSRSFHKGHLKKKKGCDG